MTLDVFASETGYYNFATYIGSSPDIAVTIGQSSKPDGASDWSESPTSFEAGC